MFGGEDFDLDEDFLKDVGEKEEQYYSQVLSESRSSQAEPLQKRGRFENLDSDFGDITFDDEPDFVRNAANCTETNSGESHIAPISSCSTKLPDTRIVTPPSQLVENAETSRKNLALEILRKGASSNAAADNLSPMRSTPLREISHKGARHSLNSVSPQENRRKRNSDGFKKPAARLRKSPERSRKRDTSRDSPKYRSAPRMTLERKFPGPAGLLPDNYEANFDHTNIINNHDVSGLDVDDKLDESRMSEFCSQNTSRLFSVGAWRSMLDDLPPDFLKGHEIAEIKSWAKKNCGVNENSRAPYLAGVVHKIDHNSENPRLILKDLSDSIEATMHCEIPVAHPNILQPGVVVLLQNVRLLGVRTSKKGVGVQFHAMISPNNILAAYNEKKRLVTSSWMESVLGESSKTLGEQRSSEFTENIPENRVLENNRIFAGINVEISDFESEDDEFNFASVDRGVIRNSQVASFFGNTSESTAKTKTDRGRQSSSIPMEISSDVVETTNVENNVKESSREIELRPKKITSLRSRLMQFKSKDVLTPQISEEDKSAEEARVEKPAFATFGDDLLDSDNDTEDEILSQFDMDSIATGQ